MKPSRITRAREMAGLSIAQAAKLLGWPGWMLKRYESRAIEPTGTAYQSLADAYGVSVEWLRGWDVELPQSTRAVLRDVEHTGDRARLTELLEATQGKKP